MANEKRIDDFVSLCKKCDHYLVCKYVDDETAECSQYKSPIVDAVEVVHAKAVPIYSNIRYEDTLIRMDSQCPLCGALMLRVDAYCPNCGAKMDGDGNE